MLHTPVRDTYLKVGGKFSVFKMTIINSNERHFDMYYQKAKCQKLMLFLDNDIEWV